MARAPERHAPRLPVPPPDPAPAPPNRDCGRLPAQVIAVVGEALADLIADGEGTYHAHPGGSPANVAVGLARLGVPVRMGARLADDPLGLMLRRHLERNGVDCRRAVRAGHPSSLALVHPTARQQTSYDLRLDGTGDWQWTRAEAAGVLGPDLVALHVGSLAMVLPPGADVLRQLVLEARAKVTISYDPNIRPEVMERIPDARERIEELIALADVVKLSDEDLAWLRPGVEPRRFAEERVREGAALVAVTCGADGAVAAAACGVLQVPARRTTVVDTVGAGDSYMSSLLAGLHRRGLLGAPRRPVLRAQAADGLSVLLDEAARAAALTCGRPGADPPSHRELATVPGA